MDGLFPRNSSMAVDEPSTAVTRQPRSAKYRALRPGPEARSSARPGASPLVNSTTSGAGLSRTCSPARYRWSHSSIREGIVAAFDGQLEDALENRNRAIDLLF